MNRGLFTFLLLLASLSVWATHNRAGEITYVQTGPNSIKITVTTYTKADSDAKRPKIGVLWGDGSTDTISMKPNFPLNVGANIEKNEYEGSHTFPSSGTYIISFEDPNRNADVNNIPLSVETPFYIESKIVLNPFLGQNSSVQLLNPPIDNACKDVLFVHNPSPFDPDGDSLSYELIDSKGEGGKEIPGYFLPSGVSVDGSNGSLIWDKPTNTGEYNFAILVQEWRDGFLIGSVIRDLQVTVKECNNKPPEIEPLKDTCVVAGTTINYTIKAKDPDSLDQITLTASGGPFEVNGIKATFDDKVGIDSVQSNFIWLTECSHVRKNPYQVNFQAKDNDGNVPLLDLEIVNITVIGPKVENVNAIGGIDAINLNWQNYACSNAIGYKIYRRADSSNWVPGPCETGVPGNIGFSQIGKTSSISDTSFKDSTAASGVHYCYRIVACFPDGSEGIASDEICAEKLKVEPIPINVSVTETNSSNGKVFVRWANPPELSQLNLSGPITYQVYRNELGSTNKTLVYTSSGSSDTSFTDSSLKTETKQYEYEVVLLNDGAEVNKSIKPSSVFLTIGEFDQQLNLTWQSSTPWNNYLYVIHQETSPGSGTFNVIDTVTSAEYVHDSLQNGTLYCYKIEAIGMYSAISEFDSLINFSQIICATPKDTVPPCAPNVIVTSDCVNGVNTVSWQYQNSDCDGDRGSVKVYYRPNLNSEYNVVYESSDLSQTQTSFTNLSSVAGCYIVTLTDTVGNESTLVGDTCVDNCPAYTLPNVFTPNGDGINDLLKPLTNEYTDKIELTVYNRWGLEVFSTEDSDINWDSSLNYTNLPASPGVYYYVCVVHEIRLVGIVERRINGFFYIIK